MSMVYVVLDFPWETVAAFGAIVLVAVVLHALLTRGRQSRF